ncbi:uncharacterized protein Nmlp_3294 [Natronomonas moolapensis 8.8.11]|uniref:Uncharacterized protein n=1 Tax=Natronomonas moolapensis (strain DSM 18674 / CECT 7526 / JCM 14361 / 8.8.11) TaxID=268739 RepID=M1XSR0_NATM8|nr:DUF5794 domain-containing protein [Natronomonas moolapensis]CCQ37428.1 uncharacterized protein Nmlp_3294 [Natronomonas moolapensis 8.8.11]
MSTSRHPVALRIERRVGEGTRLLATVMALPLLDGIFAALVLAGAVSSILGMVEVGLLIFGGSATLAVVLAEMEGKRRERVRNILAVGALVIPLAAVQAAIAPTIESMLAMEVFERFAALVILAVAARTASATVGEYLPGPGVVIALGLVASFRPNGFELQFVSEPMFVVYGTGAAAIGVGFALAVALFGPWLRGNVDIDRFRFGSAVALGVLPLSILRIGPITGEEPLALIVLALTGLLAFNPEGAIDADDAGSVPAATDGGPGADPDAGPGADGDDDEPAPAVEGDVDEDGSPGVPDGDRAPWL